jgi:hypothetical protein
MGGQHVDTIVEADTSTAAILKVSDKVDQGEVKVTENGFNFNKRVHITYEELK